MGPIACYMIGHRSDTEMPSKVVRRKLQEPAKPFARNSRGASKRAGVPAVAKEGRLTLRQIRRAVETALRGQTLKADAPG
jgi:hypothetical protein